MREHFIKRNIVKKEPELITTSGKLTEGTVVYEPDQKIQEARMAKKEDDELKQKESLIFKTVVNEDNDEVKVRKSVVDLTNQLLEKNSALSQALKAGDITQAGVLKKEIVNIKQAIEDLQNIH